MVEEPVRAAAANAFNAARSVSIANSRRLSPRIAASTCVESVLARPLTGSSPASRTAARTQSKILSPPLTSTSRARNLLSTE